MTKADIKEQFSKSPILKELNETLRSGEKKQLFIKGLVGSAVSFVQAESFLKSERSFLLVFNDKEEAAYHLNDLEQLVDEKNVCSTLEVIDDLTKLRKLITQIYC